MNTKPILVVAGSPKSIFFEIFLKSLNYKKYKRPLILICSKKLLFIHMAKNNIKKKNKHCWKKFFEKFKIKK